MSRRSRAREVALQVLFQEEVNPRESLDELGDFVATRLKSDELERFCLALLKGVKRNQDELDDMLAKIATNWSLDRMAATDRNVLRLKRSNSPNASAAANRRSSSTVYWISCWPSRRDNGDHRLSWSCHACGC